MPEKQLLNSKHLSSWNANKEVSRLESVLNWRVVRKEPFIKGHIYVHKRVVGSRRRSGLYVKTNVLGVLLAVREGEREVPT